MLSGGCGCIGGLTNMCPELFVEWTKTLNEKNWDKVAEIQKKVNRMMEMFDISAPFLTAVKRAMHDQRNHFRRIRKSTACNCI